MYTLIMMNTLLSAHQMHHHKDMIHAEMGFWIHAAQTAGKVHLDSKMFVW